LDFTAVDHLDVTSVQNLIDVRGQLDRHASPDFVEWHFAGISSAWVRRALIAGGFGHPAPDAKPLFSVADVTGANDFKTKEEVDYEQHARDEENDPASRHTSRLPVISLDRQVMFSASTPTVSPKFD
jgi:sodium-independent sulfate anion transporter 11